MNENQLTQEPSQEEADRAIWIAGYNLVAAQIEAWADRKGWNEDDPTLLCKTDKVRTAPRVIAVKEDILSLKAAYDVSKLGLMMTEIAEAIEGRRHGDPKSDKLPAFTQQEEELADCIVRIMHYSAHEKLRVAEALVAKLDYNEKRPYKHGKQV